MEPRYYRFEGFRFDAFKGTLEDAAGKVRRLRARECDALALLVRAPEQAVSNKEFYRTLWKSHPPADPRKALDSVIHNLRKALGDTQDALGDTQDEGNRWRFIVNSSKKGFLLIPTAAKCPDSSPPGLRPPLLVGAGAIADSKVAAIVQDFVGREYVFTAIERFMASHTRGYFTIEGDPGVGKTSLLAKFAALTGCLIHFNSRSEGVTTIAQFMANMSEQIVSRYSLGPPASVGRQPLDGAYLADLLRIAAASLGVGDRVIMAVDALDEVSGPHEGNVLNLPQDLPDSVYIVTTRRRVKLPLSVHEAHIVLDLTKYARESKHDIETFILRSVDVHPAIKQWVDAQALPVAEVVGVLTARSCGNFMYARYVLLDIQTELYRDVRVENLPSGLEAYYEDHWRRMRMTDVPLPRERLRIVYVLSALQRPVSRRTIAACATDAAMAIDQLAVQQVLDDWAPFLHEGIVDGTKTYSLYHESFREFLRRRDIVEAASLTLTEVHGLIANHLWETAFEHDPLP